MQVPFRFQTRRDGLKRVTRCDSDSCHYCATTPIVGMSPPNCEFGPFRATALWNEAVTNFRNGMHLSDHRHRFHKHKSSFTGCEAVRFLHKCLQTNKLFNPDVTREQTKQLLTQFLSAGLICLAKECTWSNKGRFRDSSKYFYQFTEKMLSFDGGSSLASMTNRTHVNTSCAQTDTHHFEDGTRLFAEDAYWKLHLLTRLERLLHPLDIVGLIAPNEIEAKWVVTNASPEWVKMRWNTELPHWILSAIHTLLSCAMKTEGKTTYPEFEIELFRIISDYFATLESPLISTHLFSLVTRAYLYFESQIKLPEELPKSKITASQENLMELISSPLSKARKGPKMRFNVPDSCLETAFTSDDPVMRMIPQRTFDIVHLKRYPSFTHCTEPPVTLGTVIERNGKERKPLQIISNFPEQTSNKTQNKQLKETGIDNVAFSYFSPMKGAKELFLTNKELNYPFYFHKNSPKPRKCTKSRSSSDLEHVHVYENLGMNDTSGNLHYEQALDYEYALESVDRLLKASRSQKSLSSEDTMSTFYTASTSSNLDLDESHSYENIETKELSNVVFSSKDWPYSVLRTCASTFHLIFLLIPPNQRAQLKQLMRLLYHVPNSINVQELSFSKMAFQLLPVIFKPPVDHYPDEYNEEVLLSIMRFVASNHEEIFSDLPPTMIREIESSISAAKMKFLENSTETHLKFSKQPGTMASRKCEWRNLRV